jgi:hypothetical protein
VSAAAAALNWVHIMHVLTVACQHVHGTRALFRFYLHHHAVAFLRSGVTSESPQTRGQALRLLWWLAAHHVHPVDW